MNLHHLHHQIESCFLQILSQQQQKLHQNILLSYQNLPVMPLKASRCKNLINYKHQRSYRQSYHKVKQYNLANYQLLSNTLSKIALKKIKYSFCKIKQLKIQEKSIQATNVDTLFIKQQKIPNWVDVFIAKKKKLKNNFQQINPIMLILQSNLIKNQLKMID